MARVRTVHHVHDGWAAVAGATAYVVVGLRHRRPPHGLEARLFRWSNHDSEERPALRVPQQLGTPWVLPGLGVWAFWTHRPHLAAAATLALPLEKGLEVGLKKRLQRARPAQVDPDVALHDDAPTEGPAYPSGHAAIASTAVFLVAPYAPPGLVALLAASAALGSWVRIHQGAHWPADTVGGLALGLTVASTARLLVGRPPGER